MAWQAMAGMRYRVAGVWVWWRVQPWSLERWRDGQTPMVRAAV